MKTLLAASLILASQWAQARCESSLPLDGVASIETCTPGTSACKDASAVLYGYLELADDDPAKLTVALQSSPWRLYGPDSRILTVAEFAQMIRPSIHGPVRSVELDGSWTGAAPSKSGKSLASRLSKALDGFPVTGMNGFIWVSKTGAVRATRQAFSVHKGRGPYAVHDGDEVMAAFVDGWKSDVQDYFVKQHDAAGVMSAAVGWDVFYLCPDRALSTFELAATMGNAIAAYNAAMIRLERGGAGDHAAAVALLKRAVALGDKKSGALLHRLEQAPDSR